MAARIVPGVGGRVLFKAVLGAVILTNRKDTWFNAVRTASDPLDSREKGDRNPSAEKGSVSAKMPNCVRLRVCVCVCVCVRVCVCEDPARLFGM